MWADSWDRITFEITADGKQCWSQRSCSLREQCSQRRFPKISSLHPFLFFLRPLFPIKDHGDLLKSIPALSRRKAKVRSNKLESVNLELGATAPSVACLLLSEWYMYVEKRRWEIQKDEWRHNQPKPLSVWHSFLIINSYLNKTVKLFSEEIFHTNCHLIVWKYVIRNITIGRFWSDPNTHSALNVHYNDIYKRSRPRQSLQ